MAAITYEEIEDVIQEDAAAMYGYPKGWASKWFDRLKRLEEESFESVVYDEPRSDRPSELSNHEHDHFVQVLHEAPEDVGYWCARIDCSAHQYVPHQRVRR